MTDKKQTDWEAIERDYRIGTMTLREMGAAHGVTEGAIRKRAKRDGWTQDLSAKVRARADDLVRKQSVRSEVRKNVEISAKDAIESEAQQMVIVRLGHRKQISKAQDLTNKLLAELMGQTDYADDLAQLGELLHAPDDKGIDKLNDLYRKIIDGATRIDGLKKLSETMKNLIAMERQAYNISDEPERKTDSLSEILDIIASRGSRLPIKK